MIAIIQARMGSSRLPGKVLLPLDAKRTALECMVDRVSKSALIDNFVVATTNLSIDDEIVSLADSKSWFYERGSENDVLGRYWQAAQKFAKQGDVIVRLTSDCPVIDFRIIDLVIQDYVDGDFDFVSNSLEPYSYPDGMDVEVFSYELLERAAREAVLPSHREHVTFFFWKNPNIFSIKYVKSLLNLTRYRMTLDYQEDYDTLRKIYEHFFPRTDFSLDEIITLFKRNPELMLLDGRKVRNAGWRSALEKDECFKK